MGTADNVRPDDRQVLRDEWGQPLRIQVPGPIHKRGWDVWSCGPNGIDEQGGGDDILVGEDVASLSSER